MAVKTKPSGPRTAKIMIVGEAPGAEEERQGIPFVGASGEELTRMLHEAGIARTECFLTNISKYRPPSNEIERFFVDKKMRIPGPEIREGVLELAEEIREVKPNVILACGNIPFWVLCARPSAEAGITNWRGSELEIAETLATMSEPLGHKCAVIPTYHPAAILRQWSWRSIFVHDLRVRLAKYISQPQVQPPSYNFTVRPSLAQVLQVVEDRIREADSSEGLRLAVDIETRNSHIACVGIAWNLLEAICIPFLCVERPEGYWSAEEEPEVIMALHRLLTHPRVEACGQNFLYDAQYFARYLGFIPRLVDDTMLMQHVAWPGVSKGLDFIASMHCSFYRFWKNDGKLWDYSTPEEQLWRYNCEDAVRTLECRDSLEHTLEALGLESQYRFQMELWHHTLQIMLRGVRIDRKMRDRLSGELLAAIEERNREVEFICGHPLNPKSPKQMKAFFYEDMKMPLQFKRGARNPDGSRKVTLDEGALSSIVRHEPLLRPLVQRLLELRSLGVFLSTFVQAPLGPDGRMRCYFNPAGTETFRFSSSEDAFGSGANLQTVPRGLEDEVIDPNELVQYNLPNVRKLFIPDSGRTIGECDLAGADAQVVAWESEDEILKQIFREKRKLHVENGKMMFGSLMGPDGKREPYYTRVKIGVHLTNYGGNAKTLSAACNVSVHEAEKFQRRWFEIHPPIKEWHRRVEYELQTRRQVVNRFGYRRHFFDRIEGILPEALAWTPQSTVALVTNQALCNTHPYHTPSSLFKPLYDPEIEFLRARLSALKFEILLQVHDSFVFQYPTLYEAEVLPLLYRAITIRIPYSDPLFIPWGLKTSTISWGDAEERNWPTAREVKAA